MYARAAWLLLLVALPGIGTILYLLFGEPWISAAFHRRARDAYEALLPYAPPGSSQALSPATRGAFRTCEAASRWSVSSGNTAQVAPGADAAITTIVADIDAATRTVHLSFYIWLNDHNGTKVVDAVCRAARRGVTCRIVADAIGSRALIRSVQWKAMGEAGAHLYASLPVPFGLGILSGHRTDLRNHRKIIGRRDIADVGRYQTHDDSMQIVSGALHAPRVHFEAPPSRTVPLEMARFIAWFDASAPSSLNPLPAITRAAIAHLWFESIHPFEDGNGRIGRAIAEKALAQSLAAPTLTALAETIHRHRKAYYAALQIASQSNDIDAWLAWFADIDIEAQERTITRIRFLIDKTRLLDRLRGATNTGRNGRCSACSVRGRMDLRGD